MNGKRQRAKQALQHLRGADAKQALEATKGGTIVEVVVIDHGRELSVIVGCSDDFIDEHVEKTIQEAVKQGKSAEHNGVRHWRTWVEVVDLSKQGSAVYTWNTAGDKVKGQLLKHSVPIDDDGRADAHEVTTTIIGTTYRSPY